METALIISEIAFYSTVSLAIIVIGILCVIIAYRLVRIGRELENLSRNLISATNDASERINEIMDRLSSFPILSYFLKKHSHSRNKKNK